MPTLEPFLTTDNTLCSSVQNRQISADDAKIQLLRNLQLHANAIYENTNAKFEDFQVLFDNVFKSKVLDIHKRSLDEAFKIINTNSRQKAMAIVRDKAFLAYQRQFNALSRAHKYTTATKLAVIAMKEPIFNLPRQNWFKTFGGMTNSQRKIFELFNATEDDRKAYAAKHPEDANGTQLRVIRRAGERDFSLVDALGKPVDVTATARTNTLSQHS
jgi:hypothetical protein